MIKIIILFCVLILSSGCRMSLDPAVDGAGLGLDVKARIDWSRLLSYRRVRPAVRVRPALPHINIKPGVDTMPISKIFLNRCLDYSTQAYERHTIENEKTDTQVLLILEDKCLYIVFCGTSNGRDIKTDLRRFQTEFKAEGKGAVHTGFRVAYESVSEKIAEAVDEKSLLDIVVTGHSLGGARAQLCALDLSQQFPLLPLTVVTFGAPRVGDRYFVDTYQRQCIPTYLIEHTLDVVTMTPMFGYRKVDKPRNYWRWCPSWHKTKSYRDTLA